MSGGMHIEVDTMRLVPHVRRSRIGPHKLWDRESVLVGNDMQGPKGAFIPIRGVGGKWLFVCTHNLKLTTLAQKW